jgi:hypothetical protein
MLWWGEGCELLLLLFSPGMFAVDEYTIRDEGRFRNRFLESLLVELGILTSPEESVLDMKRALESVSLKG